MAALALVPPTHRHHDITGPVAWHMAELAGREEPWWVYAYTSMFASIRRHRWERVTSEIEDLLGRPATRFSETLQQSAP